MRIAITAVEPQLDSELDPRFGRCPYFLVVETDNLTFEAVENENQALGQGAGIQSARLLCERGVKFVLTGNCGPNAHQTLSAAGIGVVVGCSGTVRSVIEQFEAGQLQAAAGPNVAGHAGMAGGAAGSGTPMPGNPADGGPGGGMGRGMGGGGGMGRGRGGGGGMGRGRGGGGGMGRGRGGGGGRGRGRGA